MKYALLIHGPEAKDLDLTEDDWQALMEGHNAFSTTYGSKILGGEVLMPSTVAKTLRYNGSGRVAVDGPFAETKEQFGGFYIVQAASIDEALEMAAAIPHDDASSVEVRAVMDPATGEQSA